MFPVTITLHNEQQLAAVTAALLSKVEAVPSPKPQKAEKPAAPAQSPAPSADTAGPAPKAEVKPDPKPEATTSSAKPSASVDYPTLQKAVFTLAIKSREAAGEVAASFGVKTFKELDPSKWAEALAAVNAKLESL